jgi:hypothetical protein
MKLPPLEYFTGRPMENGEVVIRSVAHKGEIYLFTEHDIYVVKKISWLSRKWTAVKSRFQRWWEVGWEIPQ